MRLFISIDPGEAARSAFRELGERILGCLPNEALRVSEKENIHLTLRFLGDTEVSRVPALSETLRHIACTQEAFSLESARLDCFSKVVWLGLRESQGLVFLVDSIRRGFDTAGFPPEDLPFRAHFTLARSRIPLDQVFRRSLSDFPVEPRTIPVESFQLMKSELLSDGPRYSVVESYLFDVNHRWPQDLSRNIQK